MNEEEQRDYAAKAKELTKKLNLMFSHGASIERIAHDLHLPASWVAQRRQKFFKQHELFPSIDYLCELVGVREDERVADLKVLTRDMLRDQAKRFTFSDINRPIVRPVDPLFREELLAIDDSKWIDTEEMVAAEGAGLGWMLRPFKYHYGAFGHPDLHAALDEFDDINCDKDGLYAVDPNGEHIFHMPLAEFLRRCRLNEKHKR